MVCPEAKCQCQWSSVCCSSDKENESGGEEQNGVSKETNDNNTEHIESQEKSEEEEDETVSTTLLLSSLVSVSGIIHFLGVGVGWGIWHINRLHELQNPKKRNKTEIPDSVQRHVLHDEIDCFGKV